MSRAVQLTAVMKLIHHRELRSSLNTLSALANNVMRQLDNSYYSLLEKIGTLRATIGLLQELSIASRQTNDDFNIEVVGLEQDIRRQIDAFGAFESQQSRIEELESRIKSGQSKAQSLSERLEAARQRVELWERRENEWQAKTSSRASASCHGMRTKLILRREIKNILDRTCNNIRPGFADVRTTSYDVHRKEGPYRYWRIESTLG